MVKGLEVIQDSAPWAYRCFHEKTSASEGEDRQDLVLDELARAGSGTKSRRVVFKIRLRSSDHQAGFESGDAISRRPDIHFSPVFSGWWPSHFSHSETRHRCDGHRARIPPDWRIEMVLASLFHAPPRKARSGPAEGPAGFSRGLNW